MKKISLNRLKYLFIKNNYPRPPRINIRVGYGKDDVSPADFQEDLMAVAMKKAFPKKKS